MVNSYGEYCIKRLGICYYVGLVMFWLQIIITLFANQPNERWYPICPNCTCWTLHCFVCWVIISADDIFNYFSYFFFFFFFFEILGFDISCNVITYFLWKINYHKFDICRISSESSNIIPYYTCPKFWLSPFYYLLICLKTTGWVANSVDPDQMPQNVASDLGLHCLLSPVCLTN